jgi:hypothetical protein
MAEGIASICQAMVLCEGLYQSPSTGRMSRLETIGNLLLADGFPQPWSHIVVYIILTSGHGPTDLTLRWIDPDGELLPGPSSNSKSISQVLLRCVRCSSLAMSGFFLGRANTASN